MAAVPAWSRSSETPSRITICRAADRAEAFRSQEEGRYCRAISSGAILFTTTEAELLLTTYLLRLRSPKMSDRKSTRLNSSHLVISYAVFCLKKKKKQFIKPRM